MIPSNATFVLMAACCRTGIYVVHQEPMTFLGVAIATCLSAYGNKQSKISNLISLQLMVTR